MKGLRGKNDEIFAELEKIPLSFFIKQVVVMVLISGNLLIFAQFSNSQIVFTLSLLTLTQLTHYLLVIKTQPLSKYSLKLLNKIGQLFSSSLFLVLLSWTSFNSLFAISKTDYTNSTIVLLAGCELLLLSILKKRINRPELDLKFGNLEIFSSLFCIFCGILLNIYDGLSVIDCYFNITLSSMLLMNNLYRVIKGVFEITNSASGIEEDIDEILAKYKGSISVIYIDYIIHNFEIRIIGSVKLTEPGLGKEFLSDLRIKGYKPTFYFQLS